MFLIVHNPLSNNRKSKKTTNKMIKFFKKNQIPFNVRSTLKIENLNQYLEGNSSITDILYLGGDGSINYLINSVDIAAIKQNIYLSKSGSGNDFLRSLKKIGTANVSIGEASTNTKSTKFINGCGMGIDAEVCYYVNNDSKKNKLSYFKNVFKAVLKYGSTTAEVDVDGTVHHFEKVYFVSIQNGKYYGGGMKVAPKGNIEDDYYEVCVAHNLNKLLIQALFLTIYPGWHTSITKRVTMLRGKTITVKMAEPKYFQADGEVLDGVNEIVAKKFVSREFIAFSKRKIKKLYGQKQNG